MCLAFHSACCACNVTVPHRIVQRAGWVEIVEVIGMPAMAGQLFERCITFCYCVGTCSAESYRALLAISTAASTVTPANTSMVDLTATQAIAMLCARDMTAVQYVQALFSHYDTGGFECLNAFISLNRTQVCLLLSST